MRKLTMTATLVLALLPGGASAQGDIQVAAALALEQVEWTADAPHYWRGPFHAPPRAYQAWPRRAPAQTYRWYGYRPRFYTDGLRNADPAYRAWRPYAYRKPYARQFPPYTNAWRPSGYRWAGADSAPPVRTGAPNRPLWRW